MALSHSYKKTIAQGEGRRLWHLYGFSKPQDLILKDLALDLGSEGETLFFKISDFLQKDINEYLNNLNIVDNFRERRNVWVEDFKSFAKQQWEDFSYKHSDGECLKEVQERNVKALFEILERNEHDNIAIGTHGTALNTIINYFNPDFLYKGFEEIRPLMPHIVCFDFDKLKLNNIEHFVV